MSARPSGRRTVPVYPYPDHWPLRWCGAAVLFGGRDAWAVWRASRAPFVSPAVLFWHAGASDWLVQSDLKHGGSLHVHPQHGLFRRVGVGSTEFVGDSPTCSDPGRVRAGALAAGVVVTNSN